MFSLAEEVVLDHPYSSSVLSTSREAELSEDSDEEMEAESTAPTPRLPPKAPKHDLMMVEEVRNTVT